MNDDNLADTSSKRPSATITPFRLRPVAPKVTSPNTPDPAMVKLFEDYLKAAKAGKIKFVAMALVDADGVAYSTWEPAESNPQLITQALGSVGYLNFRFAEAAAAGATENDSFRVD